MADMNTKNDRFDLDDSNADTAHGGTEPATAHDVKEGGILGAVGGAVVGVLAGGPIGAIIGAVAGGAASAAAVDVVDKYDNDYDRTAGTDPVGTLAAIDTTAPSQTSYPSPVAPTVVPTASPAYAANLAQNAEGQNTGGETVIPIIEEELEVGKRKVQAGGARIKTTVSETPVSEQVTLHEEHVTVDRHSVNQPVLDTATAFKESTFEVTETAEVPVIAKEARVVEEVVVGKTATDRVETIRDTVRRTEVDVEELNADGSMKR